MCLYRGIGIWKKLSTQKSSSQGPRESVRDGNEKGIDEVVPEVEIWHQLWPRLATLPHLTNLDVWLDHDYLTWSAIDERSLLRPITLADWGPQVRITVRMPNLPKDKIRPALHYSEDNREKGLGFRILRRVRRPEVTPLWRNWILLCPDVEDNEKDEYWGCNLDGLYPRSPPAEPCPIPQPEGWWVGI